MKDFTNKFGINDTDISISKYLPKVLAKLFNS